MEIFNILISSFSCSISLLPKFNKGTHMVLYYVDQAYIWATHSIYHVYSNGPKERRVPKEHLAWKKNMWGGG